MVGMAKELFKDRYKNSPWESKNNSLLWPLLNKLVKERVLAYVDLALAERILLASNLPLDEAKAAFICYLSLASRKGHLCITIDGQKINPELKDILFSGDRNTALENESSTSFKFLIEKGAQELPFPALFLLEDQNSICVSPICKKKNNYYLQRYWYLESLFIEHINPLLNRKEPDLVIDIELVERTTNQMQERGELLSEQAKAILQSCRSCLTIITGGPGTGKTYTAGMFIRIIWKNLSPEQRYRCQIELAAPTGKAAANLEASIRQALSDIEDIPRIRAKTLHSLLKKTIPITDNDRAYLKADILIVDESSMIDVELMTQLIACLNPGGRLLMLGDHNQLPPIEAGAVFSNLINFLSLTESFKSHVNELKTCLRAELKEIIELSTKIKDGDHSGSFELLQKSNGQAIRFIDFETKNGIKFKQKELLEYGMEQFALIGELSLNPLEILKMFSQFRILTPLRKGPFGFEVLNSLFLEAFLKRNRNSKYIALPIMIAENDERVSLFNGEIGLFIRHNESKEEDYAIFVDQQVNAGFREIPFLLLPKFEYAFCISVHKSQGSEFDRVLMILPEGAEVFGREILYTGVTRARKSVEIWGKSNTFFHMMQSVSKRNSGLVERLIFSEKNND